MYMRFKASNTINLHNTMTYVCLHYYNENSKVGYISCYFSLLIFYFCCCLLEELPTHLLASMGIYEKTGGIRTTRREALRQ